MDSTTDVITESAGAGTDTVQSSVTFSLATLTNIENLTLTGTAAINGTGNAANNVITGNDANNTLNGGAGTDTLIGGAGNDIYQVDSTTDGIIELVDGGTDTVQSSVSFSLAALTNVENLTLTGTTATNGTGNAANNVITGNSANNIINGDAGLDTLNGGAGLDNLNGGAGADTLTGGTGADVFVFQFGQSTISAPDRITDFAIGSDKVDLLSSAGAAIAAPLAFSRASDFVAPASNLNNVVTAVFADANGALAGNQALGINSAALVQVTTAGIAGTYLIVNDNLGGFQSGSDSVVNITGYTGTLPALGNIPVGNFFV